MKGGTIFAAGLSAVLLVPAARGASSYRDYAERFVRKSPERRRLAVALTFDREGMDRGGLESRILPALLMARFREVPYAEFLPRVFVNADSTLLSELAAMDVDDLLRVRFTRLTPPVEVDPARARPHAERRYLVEGSVEIVSVCRGNTVTSASFEALPLPDMDGFGDSADGQAATLALIAAHVTDFYGKHVAALKTTPPCTALDAASAAEQGSRWDDAARILSGIIARDPSQEQKLGDRRDLALMRASRAATPPASVPSAGPPPRGGIDFLDPANRGRLFPVSQGSVPVRERVTGSFALSVDVLVRDAEARGGIMVSGRTKNVYVGLTPASGRKGPKVHLESQNLVTGVWDDREAGLADQAFVLGRPTRLEVRYDGTDMSILVDGRRAFYLPRVILDQTGLFLFGKLSTVYFKDAVLMQ